MDIFYDRYARRDSNGGRVEHDIEEMWDRVANHVGNDPQEKFEFRNLLQDMKFLPGGRILSAAGAEKLKTFYNCFVIPVETSARRDNRDKKGYKSQRVDRGNDSREAIFDTIGTMVGIMSRGGGVGINWSVLRPKGTYLERVSGTTSGPVSWMDVASRAVGVVEQGGTRRGAAMFMLDDWHPDVREFIEAKKTPGMITNANISVAVSDKFMEAVKNDEDWEMVFPDTTHDSYDTEWDGDLDKWTDSGHPTILYDTVSARTLWRLLTDSAWASGEPGVVFLGRYNGLSTGRNVERIICVNPCGEQGLGAYSVCNLGAMNLDAYCVNGSFLWGEFSRDVRTAVRFLDNIIDKDFYFVPETEKQQKNLRRMGLGVMGLADALVRQKIRYGSPEAVRFTEDVFSTMKQEAIEESALLAFEKGPAEAWDRSMWGRPYLKSYTEEYGFPLFADAGMRNLFLLTQAPTGTTSLLAGVNSGIEPYFNSKAAFRSDRTGTRYVGPKAVQDLDLEEGVAWPDYIVDSRDITVEEHIAMQAAVQKYVDSSVSKTINAPADQTPEETAKAYMLAYDSGLKGLAYYRDGSRSIQVLYHSDPNERIKELEEKVSELTAKLESPWRASQNQVVAQDSKFLCPSCEDGEVVFEEGCKKCHSCGWSAC